MIDNRNKTSDEETYVSGKNISIESNLCKNKHNLFCPICIRSHSFSDRSHLRIHLEDVHRVYGRLLLDVLDDAIENGSLDLEEFAREYDKISKNNLMSCQILNFHKEGIQ